ncbi:MAG: hypothetical protein HQL98_10585 [Magnetococcales bacterium]|nr:hypothetical protein [Magnetococcales bacterium]
MLNPDDLQSRKFASAMTGQDLLTSRSSSITDGTTQYIYLGMAYPGSEESDPVWMVKRIAVDANGDTATLFAGGQAQFNQAWTDRAALSYA